MEPLRILLVVEQPLFLQGIRFTLSELLYHRWRINRPRRDPGMRVL